MTIEGALEAYLNKDIFDFDFDYIIVLIFSVCCYASIFNTNI